MIMMALVEQDYVYIGDWVETPQGQGEILDIKITRDSYDLVVVSPSGFRDGTCRITTSAEDCLRLS